jgi:hypothetical protein
LKNRGVYLKKALAIVVPKGFLAVRKDYQRKNLAGSIENKSFTGQRRRQGMVLQPGFHKSCLPQGGMKNKSF